MYVFILLFLNKKKNSLVLIFNRPVLLICKKGGANQYSADIYQCTLQCKLTFFDNTWMEKQDNSSTKSKEAHRLLKVLHPEVKRNFEILNKIGSGYYKINNYLILL